MNLNNFYITRKNTFRKIEESNTAYKILLSILMACFTGIMAQIVIPLSFTPIPITCQTIAVLSAGLILGKKYGALSQIFYILFGILFIPWFNNMSGGIEVLFGSNIGYLIGFILASYFIGYLSEKNQDNNKFKNMILISSITTFICIYIPGLIGLGLFTYFNQGVLLSIPTLLILGLIPFILGDLIKIFITSTISKIFLPKKNS